MNRQYIEVLRDYLEACEVVVQFEKNVVCAFWGSEQEPLITIDTKVKGDKRLYVLLHEAGHYLNSLEHKNLDWFREEQVAWEKGIELAKNLNIPVDEGRYWKYAGYNLKLYLKEYMNVKCQHAH